MALTLTVGAYTVPVRQVSGDIDYEDQVFRGQRFDGSLAVVERSANDAARTVAVETPRGYADVDALETLLAGAAFVSVSGTIWDADSVDCEVSDIERVVGPLGDQVVLRFSLTERLA